MKNETVLIRHPEEADLSLAASILQNGGLVAFPTETVYGLGGNALLPDAAKQIYAAKGRPSDNPLIIHLAKADDAEQYCETNELYYRLTERFSPGPLTLILRKKDCIPKEVTGGLQTVAVRIPGNELARRLIEKAGVPVAAPSANTSGRPSPTTADHVYDDLNGRIDLILDGGACDIGVESTIVKIDDGCMTLLRPGAITPAMLRSVDPTLSLDDCSMGKVSKDDHPLAPGMKYRHYAPRAVVIVLDGTRTEILSYLQGVLENDPHAGVLSDGEDMQALTSQDRCISLGCGDDSADLAKHLFAALREVDQREQIKTVYVAMPKQQGIGLAVYNRLMKAAGFTVLTLKDGNRNDG